MLDQAENLRRLANKDNSKKKAKIITITSGKGGVGKSNFVVNMGITLHKKGKKVLIFDADIGMGNDDVLMGALPSYNVFDLLEGKDINEVVVEGPYGINLLPGGSGINYIENLEEGKETEKEAIVIPALSWTLVWQCILIITLPSLIIGGGIFAILIFLKKREEE